MGRSLSPILRRELENLDKDADSRRSAMKALKSYIRDLDSTAIPMFLAQVSQTKETGSLSGECTILLYEVVARVQSVKIVPLINSIMTTIMKTLALSAGSFPLEQACSKVVPAIALYEIDPTNPEGKKRHIIHSICTHLSDSLLDSQRSFTSGAALCLRRPLLIQIIGGFLWMRWLIGYVRMFLELWRRSPLRQMHTWGWSCPLRSIMH